MVQEKYIIFPDCVCTGTGMGMGIGYWEWREEFEAISPFDVQMQLSDITVQSKRNGNMNWTLIFTSRFMFNVPCIEMASPRPACTLYALCQHNELHTNLITFLVLLAAPYPSVDRKPYPLSPSPSHNHKYQFWTNDHWPVPCLPRKNVSSSLIYRFEIVFPSNTASTALTMDSDARCTFIILIPNLENELQVHFHSI